MISVKFYYCKDFLSNGLINAPAAKYVKAARNNTALNPKDIAIIIAKMELITDAAPFTHHAHGIISFPFSPNILIPIGNGMPIRIAIGHNIDNVITALKIRLLPKKRLTA